MPYLKKTNPGTSTSLLVSADQWNDIVGRLTGEVLTDTTFEWNLANPTRYKNDMLRIWQPSGTTFAIHIQTTALSASRNAIIPALTAHDTFVFLAQVQTLTNKVIDVVNNSIVATGAATGSLLKFNGTKYVDFPKGTALQIPSVNSAGTDIEWIDPPEPPMPGMPAGGVATFSGDAIETEFVIAHGLTLGAPDVWFALPTGLKPDTFGEYDTSVDANNITITYQVPPPSGTNNLKFVWSVGYVGFSEPTIFTPNTSNVVTNKTMSGANNSFSNIPFNAITDVNITSPVDGDILEFDGTDWVNIPNTGGGGGGGGLSAGGTINKSGDGATTTISIAHGLSTTPDVYFAFPLNAAARGNITYGIDATNITLTYPIAPELGTNNLSYVWGAGYVNEAVPTLTATSATTFTNKTFGDQVIFNKIAVPANQTDVETGLFYFKEIDANNNTFAGKQQIGGSIVEVEFL